MEIGTPDFLSAAFHHICHSSPAVPPERPPVAEAIAAFPIRGTLLSHSCPNFGERVSAWAMKGRTVAAPPSDR
jgi:hypothetical protein